MTLEEWMLDQPYIGTAMDQVVAMTISILISRMSESELQHHIITSKTNIGTLTMHLELVDDPVKH